MKTQQKLARN